ncbi:hypothetical protein DBV15_12517 [Temnothorax longispinosus]|uniref:HTH CENPB-type domain-containing protein n=1 Tax=Temnothorax longispinosus TaxID=300112 RepID=A0A4S2KIH4_9HYME|nr:hypothetical protein DBV15_12517 [Temnothorax longispinosus]
MGVPLRTASKMHNVPRSTLYNKHKQGVSQLVKKRPSSILSAEEETQLVKWIFHVSKKGFPISKDQLCDSAARLVVRLERPTPFKENRPGRHWYEAFLRRHPELSRRIAQNLSYSRASATEERLRNWFAEVESYLTTQNLLNIDPSRVYNCDESAFFLCPKAENVIARKGARSVYKVVNGDEECLTVLFTVNAADVMAPPMVMYWYRRIPASIARNVPKGWNIGTSERGWMTAETFYVYIANVFYPWLKENNVEFPVVLYVDGHFSHCTMPLSEFCRDSSNRTDRIPLDVAVFHPLKSSWKKTVNKWRLDHDRDRLTKNFAPVLKTAIDSMNLTGTIIRGFASCGLFPFSANAVDFDVLRKGLKKRKSKEDNKVESQAEDTKSAEFLKFFEERLPAGLLPEFIESERISFWSGAVENRGLFTFWLQMKGVTGYEKMSVDSGTIDDAAVPSDDQKLEDAERTTAEDGRGTPTDCAAIITANESLSLGADQSIVVLAVEHDETLATINLDENSGAGQSFGDAIKIK